MTCRADAACPEAMLTFATRDEENLQALDGSLRWPHQVAAFCQHKCTSVALSTRGTSVYPLAAPPSRVEELVYRVLAEKGAFHDFVSSLCTSGMKGTGADRGLEHGCHFRVCLGLKVNPRGVWLGRGICVRWL